MKNHIISNTVNEPDKLVCRYVELVARYSSIPHGIGWKPEYEAEEKKLKEEMQQIRQELGI